MRLEAVKAGYYVNPMGIPKAKIQILTIEGLLNGTEKADYFDLTPTRKAKREVDAAQQLGFDSAFYLSEVQTTEGVTEDAHRKGVRVARAVKPRKTRKKIA